MAKAHQARRESSGRSGTQRAMRERMERRSEQIRAAARQRYDVRARELGHRDIKTLLDATTDLRDLDLGALLGVSESTAGRLRQIYGQRPPVRPASRRAEQVRRGTRRKYDQRAQQAGYPDITRLLSATRHLPIAEVAALLATSQTTAWRLRRDPRMLD